MQSMHNTGILQGGLVLNLECEDVWRHTSRSEFDFKLTIPCDVLYLFDQRHLFTSLLATHKVGR